MSRVLLPLALALLWVGASDAARILGLFDYPGKSHFMVFEGVMKALAARGHEVVVFSHYPQPAPVPNYSDVSLVGTAQTLEDAVPLEAALDENYVHATVADLSKISVQSCDTILSSPPMQQLIKSNQHFDLIFTEAFAADCMLPFVHKFKAPNIALRSGSMMPWTADRFGLPDNPAYIPVEFGKTSDRMGFFERLTNTWDLVYSKWLYTRHIDDPTTKIVKKHFGGNLPPLQEIGKYSTSMFFINTHPAITPTRPLVPAVVEIAGIHLKPAKKLPEDIQKFMDEAKHGVIYFTFGSTVKTRDLSAEKLNAILGAFSELPQRVIWKWEDEKLPGKPANVLTRKWMPQYDILSHPNMKLFITHGGLLGTIEASYNGVPLLGIPLFGDQPVNARMYERRGIGLHLSFKNITKESLLGAVKTILHDPGYKKRSEQLSVVLNDSIMTPQEKVVYWSEYVMRHKGAQHMRSAAVDLKWYQLLLFDIITVLLLVSISAIAIIIFLLRLCLQRGRKLVSSISVSSSRSVPKKNKRQ